jgi:uncharacterized coiled-coil protein SlyX
VNKKLLANALAQISFLEYDISKADSIITALNAEIAAQRKITESYKDEMAAKETVSDLLKIQIKGMNKDIRRQRRGKIAAIGLGILSTAATFYFSNK